MIHFFSNTASGQNTTSQTQISSDLQSIIDTLTSELFSQLMSGEDNTVLKEKASYVKEQLRKDIQQACFHAQERVSLEVLRRKLNQGDFDEQIFSKSPSCTEELRKLITDDPHSFINHLFFRCEDKDVLEYWFDRERGKVPFPSGYGIAQAIHLRSSRCVFEQLKQEGCFDHLSSDDIQKLSYRARRFLNEKPESLEFFENATQPNPLNLAN